MRTPPLPLSILDAPPTPTTPVRVRTRLAAPPRGLMLRAFRAAGAAADRGGALVRIEVRLRGGDAGATLAAALYRRDDGDTAVLELGAARVTATGLDELTEQVSAVLATAPLADGPLATVRAAQARRRSSRGALLLENPFRDPDRPDEARSDLACGTFQLASALTADGSPCWQVPGALHAERGLDDPGPLLAALRDQDPAVVGVTALEDCLPQLRTLTDLVAAHSDAVIAVGGPVATWTPEHALAHLPAVHLAVRA